MPQSSNQTLQVTTGSAGVFNQLRRAITEGEYQFNERLPSERDLAEQYDAARGTIRAALLQLEEAHLVRRKFGSGTFVNYNDQFEKTDIAEETSPIELIETRLALEPYIMKLVVLNANNRDIRRLEEALNNVVESANANEFSIADEAFHLMLAHCTQNPLIIWVYQRINDIRSHNQWTARKSNILTTEKIRTYNAHHQQILTAIKQRNVEKGVKVIKGHLRMAREDLTGA